MRPFTRRAGKAAAVVLLAAIALVALAHLPPVRRAVARAIEDRAGRALEARLSIGGLDYNLLTRRATIEGLRVDSAAGTPIFEARRIEIRVPLSALAGAREITALEIDAPRLHLDALRAWLDAQPPRERAPASPFFLQRLRIADLHVVGAAEATSGFSLDLEGLSVDSTPEGRGFSAPVQGRGGWLRAGDYRTGIEALSGTLAFDGERLRIDPLALRTSDHDLVASGTMGLFTASPAWDLAFESTSDVGVLLANWPAVPASRGLATITGTVTGELGAPVIAVEAAASELAMGDAIARRITAEASVSTATGGVTVSRLRAEAFGGTVEARIQLPGGEGADEGSLEWSGVSLRESLRAAGLDMALAGTASGRLRFRGDIATPAAWDASGDIAVTPGRGKDLRAAGRATLGLRGGRWTVRLAEGALGDATLTLDASGALPAGDRPLTDSSLGGRATLSAGSVVALVDDLRRLGLDIPTEVDRVDGPLALDVTLGGSIVRPDLRTSVDGQSLSVRGLGDVAMAGAVGLERGRTLVLDGVLLTADARQLALDGRADLRGGEVALDVAASGWRPADVRTLGLEHDYLPTAGTLAARGRVSGTLGLPAFVGQVDLGGLDGLGQRLDRVTGGIAVASRPAPVTRRRAARAARAATAWHGEVALQEVVATSGDGRLALDASLTWPGQAIRMKASGTRWPLAPVRLPGRAPADAIDVAAIVD
ncbi:MAG: hypothetical protein MUF60_00820, partial [Vicinamibacterales bacterium]|nr:hypothetical protein [Vicinamibacterales bacterium]